MTAVFFFCDVCVFAKISFFFFSSFFPRLVSAETQGRRKHSKDAHALGEDGRTPSPTDVIYCSIYVFYCVYHLCFLCYLCHMISTGRKTHKPRGRASDISTISTCIYVCYDILPTPPPISVRTAGGITVVYLCSF